MTDERMDRYARGELTPEESRELARASLDDPELFEDLTATALAKTAAAQMRPAPARPRHWTLGLAAAAAVALVGIYLARTRTAPSAPALQPTLAFSPAQPVLLMGEWPWERQENAPVFRGDETAGRAPKQSGAIVSVEDGVASVDLGSVDGLAKGTELQVYRGEQSVGRLSVTTVFRERARGETLSGSAQAGNEVRVPDSVFLKAMLAQVDSAIARGDAAQARTLAQRAVEWASSAALTADERRGALEKLAALEYRAGDLPASEKHYEAAAESLSSAPALEQALVRNNLAVLQAIRGFYDGARALLSSGPADSRSLNNLGALAELQGDRAKAESYYQDALRALERPEDRRAVEANLSRVRSR